MTDSEIPATPPEKPAKPDALNIEKIDIQPAPDATAQPAAREKPKPAAKEPLFKIPQNEAAKASESESPPLKFPREPTATDANPPREKPASERLTEAKESLEHLKQQHSKPDVAPDEDETAETPLPPAPPRRKLIDGGTIRLPNARQNKEYVANLQCEKALYGLYPITLTDDDGTGLTFCPEKRQLTGMPTTVDDHQLKLHGLNSEKTTVEVTLELLINPDPKTLWVEIEPETGLFAKPHQHFQSLRGKFGRLTGARVRGREHARKGEYCDDDFAVMIDDAQEIGYFGMVSDGAGSARFSRLGSRILAESLPHYLRNEVLNLKKNDSFEKLKMLFEGTEAQRDMALYYMKSILGNALKYTVRRLLEHTHLSVLDEPIKLSHLYATCVAFWALPLEKGEWALASYWVGDGGLAVQQGDHFSLLGSPDSGMYAGQTRFFEPQEVTDEALDQRLQAAIYHDLQSVWAFTDGITDPKFDSEQMLHEHQPWQRLTDDLSNHLSSAEAACSWLQFWHQGENDDRTFCVFQATRGVKR